MRPRKKTVKGVGKAAVQARLLRYHEQYIKLLAGYGDDHPYWQAQALCWLMKFGLLNLRHYVEANLGGRVTEAPCLTVHYPVDWNWHSWRNSKRVGGSLNIGVLTETNTRSKKQAIRTMGGMMVKHVMILAMQDFTNNVGFEKRGNRFIPILPPDASDILSAVGGSSK